MVLIRNAHSRMINEQHIITNHSGGFLCPKTNFRDVVFTVIMALIMVYGMVVYNVALNTGNVSGDLFTCSV